MIKFLLIANTAGHLRLSRYYEQLETAEQHNFESRIISSCLTRTSKQCTIFHHEGVVIIYRKHANLFVIAGVTPDENELSILEFMFNFLEILNGYFGSLNEMDIMFNLDRVYMILDEMIFNGAVAHTSKERTLLPIRMLDTVK